MSPGTAPTGVSAGNRAAPRHGGGGGGFLIESASADDSGNKPPQNDEIFDYGVGATISNPFLLSIPTQDELATMSDDVLRSRRGLINMIDTQKDIVGPMAGWFAAGLFPPATIPLRLAGGAAMYGLGLRTDLHFKDLTSAYDREFYRRGLSDESQ